MIEEPENKEQAPEEEPAADTGAGPDEAAEETETAPAEEAGAEAADSAPPPDEAPAEETPAADEGEGEDAEPSARSPDEEELGPKQRRKLERSRHSGEARPPRSPEDRQRERAERRRQTAQSRRRWRARRRERRQAAPAPEPQPPVERETGKPRVRQGVVVSDRADKTITVRIDMQRPHRTYGKIVRTSSTLHVHDEGNEAHQGDTVRVVESRPLSRTKRWRLVEVLERAR